MRYRWAGGGTEGQDARVSETIILREMDGKRALKRERIYEDDDNSEEDSWQERYIKR